MLLCKKMVVEHLAVNDKNQVTIANAKCIPRIVSAMVNHSSNATVQHFGCGALCVLASKNYKNRVTIVQAGGITTILSAMKIHSSNATVQENGCGALANLAVNKNNSVHHGDGDE